MLTYTCGEGVEGLDCCLVDGKYAAKASRNSTAASSAEGRVAAAVRHRSTRPRSDGEREAAAARHKAGQRDAIPTVPTPCRLALNPEELEDT